MVGAIAIIVLNLRDAVQKKNGKKSDIVTKGLWEKPSFLSF